MRQDYKRIRLSALGLSVAMFVMGAKQCNADLILNWFGSSAYNTDASQMDFVLGITGYEIEDFEDTTLVSGLSYSLTNPNAGTFTALPNTYVADSNTLGDTEWDGNHVLLGNSNNAFPVEGTRVNEVTFHIPDGASSFGIGLSSFQSLSSPPGHFPVTDHRLLLNGVDVGTLETLAGPNLSPGLDRNTYLRIDGTNGDVIQSVGFANIGGSTVDLLIFDHVAFAPVPDPSALVMGLILVVPIFGRGRHLRAKRTV